MTTPSAFSLATCPAPCYRNASASRANAMPGSAFALAGSAAVTSVTLCGTGGLPCRFQANMARLSAVNSCACEFMEEP